MQNEGGVIVVSVVINPLVNHCHMAIDLLPALLQGPVLSTLPAITLSCPAIDTWFILRPKSRALILHPRVITLNYLVVMTITSTFCSHTILQKSP